MGHRRTGVALKPLDPSKSVVRWQDIVMHNGARKPSYQDAPNHIKQLWVAFTKPANIIELGITRPTDMAQRRTAFRDQHSAIDNVAVWRRQFPAYFSTC
jgi:hypothetical protein